jgi:diguanylate cyclase (GGDEF)-like protein
VPQSVVPVAALPYWILAWTYATAAFLAISYLRTQWAKTASLLLRATLPYAGYWVMGALVLGATDSTSASYWYRFYTSLHVLAILGLVDAQVQFLGFKRPRAFPALWLLALLGVAVFAFPQTASLFPMVRTPTGIWILAPNQASPVAEAARMVVLVLGLVVVLALIVRRLPGRGHPKVVGTIAAVLGAGVLIFNDMVWAPNHHTLYPTVWVTGFVILGLIASEVRREVLLAYTRVNTDLTTGAASRSFGEVYGTECLRNRPVGVIYGDMDNFKHVNDAYGHRAGDLMLREVVRRISDSCGPDDRVVRLGGDELLVILPGAGPDDGPKAIARVAEAVTGVPFVLESGNPDTVTPRMSLGWAWGGQGSTFESLVEKADVAMYTEKRRRREMPTAQARS